MGARRAPAPAWRGYRQRRGAGQLALFEAAGTARAPCRSRPEGALRHGEYDMELLTPLDTLCRLILRARELEAQVPAADPDEDPDNVDDLDDEGDQALSTLEDELNSGVEEEVMAMLDDLADDQLAETVALAWVGRGTYDASEWDDAFQEATDSVTDAATDWPEASAPGRSMSPPRLTGRQPSPCRSSSPRCPAR